MIDWKKEAEGIYPEMVALRRDFHAHPELGNKEFRTAEKIEAYLHAQCIQTRRVDTGVIGLIAGRDEKCAALRSDMDALPIEEKTNLPFASKNPGVMHACGHDMHMAALLGAASLLQKHRDALKGSVKLLFEPNEEQSEGGARKLIAAGALENPHVNAVFGAHCNPDFAPGVIALKYGPFFAAASWFEVHVHGNGCHGAEPSKGTDALAAACDMVGKLDQLRGEKDGAPYVTSIGSIHAGKAENVIPSDAVFSGIQRTFGKEHRTILEEKMKQIVERTAEAHHVTAEVIVHPDFNGVVNHEKETQLVEKTALDLFGADHVAVLDQPYMTTEDFGFFLEEREGSFWNFGIGGEYPLHSPYLVPDERALIAACAMHCGLVERYLNA